MTQEELEDRIEYLLVIASYRRREGLGFASILDAIERLKQLYSDLYDINIYDK